jgi:hypothetical protein
VLDCPSSSAADVVEQLVAETGALLATAQALEAFFQRPDCLVELLCVDCEVGSAGAAYCVTVSAKPTQLALGLLAAIRAENAELLVVERALSHIDLSVVGLANTTKERPADTDNRVGGVVTPARTARAQR